MILHLFSRNTSSLLAIVVFLCVASHSIHAQSRHDTWPLRVLVTNDDGINEERLWALGHAFAKVTETYIIASLEDRSGTSNYTSTGKNTRSLFVRRDYAGDHLTAYGVAGYPADCVAFGIKGLLRDRPPDLVVSGINGGANLGDDDWFRSGTIGAARSAAFLGVPALAVSGLDDDDEEMVTMVSQWIVEFAQSDLVRSLEPGQYLNINFPELPFSEIRGIKIVDTAPSVEDFFFKKVWEEVEEHDDETEEVWLLHEQDDVMLVDGDSDRRWYQEGYIVIVPMRVNENDKVLKEHLQDRLEEIPVWPPKR